MFILPFPSLLIALPFPFPSLAFASFQFLSSSVPFLPLSYYSVNLPPLLPEGTEAKSS